MKKIVIIIVIIGAIGAMIFFNVSKNKEDTNGIKTAEQQANVQGEVQTKSTAKGFSFGGKKPIAVDAVELKKSSISSSILITGNVEVVDKKEITATSSMKLMDVLVDVGDVVKKGTPLFSVDISSMSDELASLKINREIQNLQLQKIQGAKGTSSLAGADIAVELSTLSLASAQAAYDKQLASIEKNTLLYEEGIITKSELEVIESNTDALKQQVEVAQLNLERSENDVAQLKKTNSDSSKSIAIDVQIQLKNLESMDMNIAKLEKQLADIEEAVLAPTDGTITKVLIEADQSVMSGTPLVEIQDMNQLIIKAMIREYDITHIAVGQDVVITGDAISKDVEVLGKITFISPIAVETVINGRQTTGIEIKIAVSEGQSYLKPGYTTDCEIKTQNKENVLLVSFDMFREDKDNNKIVFVIKEGIAFEQIITLGITSDFDAEVLSGLVEGDSVIINPSLTIKDGTEVSVTMKTEEEGE